MLSTIQQVSDADFALARRILMRVRAEMRRAGEPLAALAPGGGGATPGGGGATPGGGGATPGGGGATPGGGEPDGPTSAAVSETEILGALVTVAGNSELFARFVSGELAQWRRPVYRVRVAGDVGALVSLGMRLRRADRVVESGTAPGSGGGATTTTLLGETLGVVRRVETRTLTGVVVITTAYVAVSV